MLDCPNPGSRQPVDQTHGLPSAGQLVPAGTGGSEVESVLGPYRHGMKRPTRGDVAGTVKVRGRAALAVASAFLIAAIGGCSTAQPSPHPSPKDSTAAAAFPEALVGASVGGSSLMIAQLDAHGQVTNLDQIDPPEQQVGDVASGLAGIYVTTCCEPAAGERFFLSPDRSSYTLLGNGTIQDVASGLVLTVHQSAGFVEIQPRDGQSWQIASETGHWFAADATFMPDGDIVVVATGDVDESAVFIVNRDSEHFDTDRPVLEGTALGGRLGRPAVDARGHIWLLVYQFETDRPLRRIVLDPTSGNVTELEGPAPVDHAFDATGTFLVSAYADATSWRRYDDPNEAVLDVPTMDRVDW